MPDSTPEIRTQSHPRIVTRDSGGAPNGYLVPIYNNTEGFFAAGEEPKQVYLTVLAKGTRKGPHLHFIRRGFFTCIKGDVKIVVRVDGTYQEFLSGEQAGYLSVEVPRGVPALLINVGEDEAFVLNMPDPAWTPGMNDEHSADFSDYQPNG